MKKLLLTMLLFTGSAHAQMAEVLRSEFHKEEELGYRIVGDDNWAQLDSLLKDKNIKILCLQMTADKMNEASAKKLLEWVRAGHSLWLYEAPVAGWFGFSPYYMKKEQFQSKPEKGSLGGRSVEGVATVGVAYSTHAVMSGVGQVSLFLPTLGNDTWGTVEVKGDTQALLQFNPSSPALAALRRDGRGVICYKPLVWPEVLSGDRFQANMLEFSAGYPVPGLGGVERLGLPPGPNAEYVQGNPAVPVATTSAPPTAPEKGPAANNTSKPASSGGDRLEAAGEMLTGKVVTETFRFETGNESLNVTRANAQSITMGGVTGLDELRTRDGQSKKGFLVTPKVEIEVAGQVRTFEKRQLKKIELQP